MTQGNSNGNGSSPVHRSRDEIRAAIFSSEKFKPESKIVEFFGEQIELRQMDLETVLTIVENPADRKHAMVRMIITYAYVPETNEKVFTEEDLPQLLKMPWGKDFTRVQKAIADMTDIDVNTAAAQGNSEGIPTDST